MTDIAVGAEQGRQLSPERAGMLMSSKTRSGCNIGIVLMPLPQSPELHHPGDKFVHYVRRNVQRFGNLFVRDFLLP